ncbi:demethoxyubiquinone hydroxylase family protein [Terricaulis sp.]|uniref:demethoxyubiquinone hydroxylase family protein n=1 Tax=Terricaulis sp. TaxID=2768686 RepID=UPI003782D743
MQRRTSPPMPGLGAQERSIDAMIRVDHAGEFGAVQIYRGQRAVFDAISGKQHAARVIAEMEDGEQEHLDTFDRMIAERGVRPTVMAPLWRVAGFGLGAVTALMGEKAAHACTEAVEDVIEEHYARQAQALENSGADPQLKDIVERFREDEMGHRDTAIDQGARDAPGYPLLTTVIKFGCRAAIRISEKI